MLKHAFLLSAFNLVAACADNPDQAATTVSWEQAVDLINGGDVVSAFQAHNRLVTLNLRDGSVETAMEPELDDLFDVVRDCGTPCDTIALASE